MNIPYMNRLYRIYLGARNTSHHKFTPSDHTQLDKVLNRYFKGWTKVNAVGSWDGAEEESYIITVSTDPYSLQINAGKDPIQSMSNQLKQHFGQFAIMIEDGGQTILT